MPKKSDENQFTEKKNTENVPYKYQKLRGNMSQQQKEKKKAYDKNYRMQNPEKIRAKKQNHRQQNPEKIKEINKIYKQQDLEKWKEYHKNYRQNKKQSKNLEKEYKQLIELALTGDTIEDYWKQLRDQCCEGINQKSLEVIKIENGDSQICDISFENFE